MDRLTSEALALEEIEDSKAINAALAEADAEVKAFQQAITAKGGSQSGHSHIHAMEIRLTKVVLATVEKAISKRRQLGAKLPELLSQHLLSQLKERLIRRADHFVEGEKTRLSLQGTFRGGVGGALIQQAKLKADGLKVRIGQEIEALRLEARLGLHKEENPVTFNISHSTIASLNLGTVVGDLTASVQVLNSQGQQELATVIQTLAEALAASTELQQDRRKELMEHLSFVSTEVALPPEKRKMGPLRSSIAVLREGLSVVGQLASLWAPAEQILRTLGVLT
jgi:hypothetical protein